jgi:hypothetical protein
MKNLFVTVLLLTVFITSNGQTFSLIDNIGTTQDGLIAIKKDKTWGFIDANGTLMIDFRDDLVSSTTKTPMFSSGLCLFKERKDGITYFGYINKKGEKVIPAEYLAATPFENSYARVIKHYKTSIGSSNALGKHIVNYSYNEFIIDTKNQWVQHLRGPINLLYDRLKIQQNPPSINSSFISENLIAVKEADNSYSIYKLKKE